MVDDISEPGVPVERRHQRRREDDVARDEIVVGAVEVAPVVSRLLQTGKVAAAMLAVGALVGGVGGALGQRISGPADDIRQVREEVAGVKSMLGARIDSTQSGMRQLQQSIDSVKAITSETRTELRLSNYGQCVLMRKFAPELRAPGCDAAERRGGTQR